MKFYEDGAFDLDQYRKARYRIVWVLKEALEYGFNSQQECFQDAFEKENLGPTWELMAYVAYGILNIRNGKYPSWGDVPLNFQDPTGSATSLESVASVNVKKIPNTRHDGTSINKEIRDAFANNKELIFKQLEDLNPQILILGYPEELKCIVEDIYHFFEGEEYQIQKNIGSIALTINKSKSRLYLWGYHPGYYKGDERQGAYYEDILEAVSDFLQLKR